MTVVKRATDDILSLLPVTDIMVNPVDLDGIPDRGLAAVFAAQYPGWGAAYARACSTGTLTMGRIHRYRHPKHTTELWSVVTQRHWNDLPNLQDLRRALRTLADALAQPRFCYHTVAMPMLGLGDTRREIAETEPMIMDYLDDLPNIVQVCMRPYRFVREPRYLGVIGSRHFTDRRYIALAVRAALAEWGMTFLDFDAMVSGGAKGVDEVACGRERNAPCLARDVGLRPIICHADWPRFGQNTAGFVRNRLVVDIITHCVSIRQPLPEHPSRGTLHALRELAKRNATTPETPKLVRTFDIPARGYEPPLPHGDTPCPSST